MKRPTAAPPISELLGRISPVVRSTVQAARRTVKAVAPTAVEIAYRSRPPSSSRSMWKIARYRLDEEYVVGIGTYPRYASLFFPRGRELDDGSELLEGAGKDMRFIRLRVPADAERLDVKRMVRKAFELARDEVRRSPKALRGAARGGVLHRRPTSR